MVPLPQVSTEYVPLKFPVAGVYVPPLFSSIDAAVTLPLFVAVTPVAVKLATSVISTPEGEEAPAVSNTVEPFSTFAPHAQVALDCCMYASPTRIETLE